MTNLNNAPSLDVWAGKIFSSGWITSSGGTEPVIEKATGKVLGTSGVASAEDVRIAASAAHDEQPIWAAWTGPARGNVLREMSRLILVHRDWIEEMLIRETGSIRLKAQWEVEVVAREILEAASLGSHPYGILAATAELGRTSVARRIPVGVVGIITPWNSPFILGARAIGPALALGNTVILKPDIQSPFVGGFIFAHLLELAGLPKGVFHVLPGAAETGAAIVAEPLIDMISFTGSTKVGRQIGSVAGGMLKRVSLELGGNNPFIVLEDADIGGCVLPSGADLPHRRAAHRSRERRRPVCRGACPPCQGVSHRRPD